MEHGNPQRLRGGWTEEEDTALFSLADRARGSGRPLKSVFDEMAAQSGRKPNSVRNYYYARVKNGGAVSGHSPAFVPFTTEESERLMETVLRAQAEGESVRACTLRLGCGEQRAMLRYQNKYRSLIRSDPQLVRRVMADLKRRGLPAFDPYAAPRAGRVGRPRKPSRALPDIAGEVVDALGLVEGLDVTALMTSLGRLAVAATGNAQRTRQAEQQLRSERDRVKLLVGCFSELLRVNTEFLKLPVQSRAARLPEYMRDLEAGVRPCAMLLLDEIG